MQAYSPSHPYGPCPAHCMVPVRWHAAHKETEQYFGISTDLSSCEPSKPGGRGPLRYTPLDLERAVIPSDARFKVPTLSGPYEKMDPLPGGGFVDIDNQQSRYR